MNISQELREIKNYFVTATPETKEDMKIFCGFISSLEMIQKELQDMCYVINNSVHELKKVNRSVDGDDL